MNYFTDESLMKAPVAESVRLIDFEKAEVVGGFVNNTYFLTVSGEKPYINMRVELSPVIYIRQPEYWRIEVVGILPGSGLPAFAPYSVTIPLDGIIGTKGIEVAGASSSEKIDIVDDRVELCNERGDVAYRANQVPGGVIIIAEGTHGTPGYDVFFEQSPIDIFPPEFILKHRKPDGIVIQLETPFTAVTSFETTEKIEEIAVHDAQGRHRIKVDQTPD